MKLSTSFALFVAVAAAVVAAQGCGSVGPAPTSSAIPFPPNPTPPAKWAYVDHSGTLYGYRLPLQSSSKPAFALTEWPKDPFPPSIAVGPYGEVAVANSRAIRIFKPPIVSFDPSHAVLVIPLTPAITEIGAYGADLVDMEYDPNDNLWLVNDLGGEISELRPPLSKNMVASLTLAFGQPGSKTSGFTPLQARFDVNATLYVFASAALRSRLFKDPFPYAKQPSDMGFNLSQADFVDSSQYLPQSKNPASVVLGQYIGQLHSPNPTSPPSPPIDRLAQFNEPLGYNNHGLFPNYVINTIVGALAADAPRQAFYTLDNDNGELNVYPLPLVTHVKPLLSLPCPTTATCSSQEHLFLSPK